MKYFSILVVLLLTGCATTSLGLSNTVSVSKDENYEIVANKIYQTAKRCLVKEPTFFFTGTLVRSQITLEGIVILAGTSPSPDYIDHVAIQFTIQEDGKGSIIDLYERNHPYIGKKKFNIARDWLQGNYVCTPENA